MASLTLSESERPLTASQRAALQHVRERALSRRTESVARINAVLRRAGVAKTDTSSAMLPADSNTNTTVESAFSPEASKLLQAFCERSRVAVHFHPDRLVTATADSSTRPLTVVESLLKDGIYRSQFETQISNGGLTAFVGGERHAWEAKMFGNAYGDTVDDHKQRPRYGALDFLRNCDGPAPRFGSCRIVLKKANLQSCTFSVGDSSMNPTDVATIDTIEIVLAGILESIESSRFKFGIDSLNISSFMDIILNNSTSSPSSSSSSSSFIFRSLEPGRSLDEYIESQIHSSILLSHDCEVLIVDPSFRNTRAGSHLQQLAAKFSIPLYYHCGFELGFEQVPSEFRGPAIPVLAKRLKEQLNLIASADEEFHTRSVSSASSSSLASSSQSLYAPSCSPSDTALSPHSSSPSDAAISLPFSSHSIISVALIGMAARTVVHRSELWKDYDGTSAVILQHLKQLWHVLVRYGNASKT